MASGQTHDKSTVIGAIPVGIATGIIQSPALGIVAGIAFLFGGLFLSPDLDIKSNPYKRWGIFRLYWKPYQYFIPHRSWLSHTPIIGTALRVLYLLAPGIIFANEIVYWLINEPSFWIALLGIELSAILHLILDGKLI